MLDSPYLCLGKGCRFNDDACRGGGGGEEDLHITLRTAITAITIVIRSLILYTQSSLMPMAYKSTRAYCL